MEWSVRPNSAFSSAIRTEAVINPHQKDRINLSFSFVLLLRDRLNYFLDAASV
jgi:hypothetical protein